MNGWQRLFFVITAIVVLPALSVWWFSRPKADDERYASGCYDNNINYVSPADAEAYLRTSSNLAWPCKKSLASIASGHEAKLAVDGWRHDFEQGAVGIGIFLCVLYALGWSAGWIWRGFFPKKA